MDLLLLLLVDIQLWLMKLVTFVQEMLTTLKRKELTFMNKFKFGPRMIVLFPNNFNIVLKIYGAWEWLCIFVYS